MTLYEKNKLKRLESKLLFLSKKNKKLKKILKKEKRLKELDQEDN